MTMDDDGSDRVRGKGGGGVTMSQNLALPVEHTVLKGFTPHWLRRCDRLTFHTCRTIITDSGSAFVMPEVATVLCACMCVNVFI
jgi:hypothetical protein